jgi:MinD-like ATPase involved in chromosome partitioning or flagellar assembly
VIPFDDRTVVTSVNKGVPLMVSSKTTPVARAILDLSEAVRKRVLELEHDDEAVVVNKGKFR